jgi:hypothetical protein
VPGKDENPLLTRGLFMLEQQITTPYDLYKYWKAIGRFHAGPAVEYAMGPWYEGLDRTMRHRYS